jgi:NADH-quinone oxidoreductase subunit M
VIDALFLVALPLVAAIVIAFAPVTRDLAGYLATVVALATFGGMIGLVYRFVPDGGFQFERDWKWLPDLGIRFHIGVDGLSLAMMVVTSLVVACAIAYGAWEGGERTRSYFALLLVLDAALLLLFCARDLIVFYIGFEAMLIPLYLLLGIWGGPDRVRATLKFVLYTVIGTLLMLVGMITLSLDHKGGPSFDIASLHSSSNWVFLAFAVAFAIKSPLWPFHGWVPDAYRQAPPEVAAILSGVASKAGAYGFLRIVVPIFPAPAADYRWVFLACATIGLLYGSLVAFRQPDARGIIAYSSLAQMGLVILGIFLFSDRGSTGATFQMVNHALLSAALFLIAGWVAHQTGSGVLSRLGGLARGRPVLSSLVLLIGMGSLAVPGSNTFASEFLILLGAFETRWWLGAVSSLAIVLAAMYMLRWISAVLHDRKHEASETAPPDDLDSGGLWAIVPLVLASLVLSAYPFGLTHRIDPSTSTITKAAAQEVVGR